MISFDNTEIAFADKSDKELDRARMLFQLVGSPTLVILGKRALNLALSFRLPIKGIIRKTVFDHFCGGETISQCNDTIERLYRSNVYSLLDYSSEGKESSEDLDRSAQEIIAANTYGKGDKRVPFSVFKPTAIFPNRLLAKKNANARFSASELKDWEASAARMAQICETARKNDVPIFVDAEETWFQDAIDALVEEQMKLHNREKTIVYNTIQLYRKDRLEFLKKSYEKAQKDGYHFGVKLVRGAYMEKERERAQSQGYPSPINDTKKDSDNSYNEALKFCIENHPQIDVIAGTHNEESSRYLVELMEENDLKNHDPHIVFSQLFGMSDNISYNLASKGYNVVKYVPYGPIEDVMPYLIRRAEENTSVAGQTGRELSLIMKEKARRKAS